MTPTFEFDPFRRGLYSIEELFAGFDPDRPETYAEIPDLKIYAEYKAQGAAAPSDYLVAMTRSLHDNGITQHLADAIADKRVVAIMGGHSAKRTDPQYIDAAHISARLTAKGFTVLSGGGPGAMEAVHLGAAFGADLAGLATALTEIGSDQSQLKISDKAKLVIRPDGTVDAAIATEIGAYLAPAYRIYAKVGTGGVGVPTWMYGHEPSTPFARDIAKYFQNSIREDGLLALATSGIIYVKGGPGTMQEVFQDAAQNYYQTFPAGIGATGIFSPMIFFGEHWTKALPIKPVLEVLFGAPAKPGEPKKPGDYYAEWIRFQDKYDDVVAHLESFPPSTGSPLLQRLQAAAHQEPSLG